MVMPKQMLQISMANFDDVIFFNGDSEINVYSFLTNVMGSDTAPQNKYLKESKWGWGINTIELRL